MSSQARTKQFLQDDKGFSNSVIKHESISRNLHGKQSALGKLWWKTCKPGTENIVSSDPRLLSMLHKKRRNGFSKGLEMKSLLPFLWALTQRPPVQKGPYWASSGFSCVLGTFACAFYRTGGLFVADGVRSWECRGNKGRDVPVLLQVPSGSAVLPSGRWVQHLQRTACRSGCVLRSVVQMGGQDKLWKELWDMCSSEPYYHPFPSVWQGLKCPWHFAWCPGFELACKSSPGLAWVGANTMNECWLSPKVS